MGGPAGSYPPPTARCGATTLRSACVVRARGAQRVNRCARRSAAVILRGASGPRKIWLLVKRDRRPAPCHRPWRHLSDRLGAPTLGGPALRYWLFLPDSPPTWWLLQAAGNLGGGPAALIPAGASWSRLPSSHRPRPICVVAQPPRDNRPVVGRPATRQKNPRLICPAAPLTLPLVSVGRCSAPPNPCRGGPRVSAASWVLLNWGYLAAGDRGHLPPVPSAVNFPWRSDDRPARCCSVPADGSPWVQTRHPLAPQALPILPVLVRAPRLSALTLRPKSAAVIFLRGAQAGIWLLVPKR